MRRLSAALVLLALCLLPASASVMTFESLASAGVDWHWSTTPYDEAGYRLTAPDDFCSAQTGNSEAFAGSTGLANCYGNVVTTLTRIDGGLFTLNAIDLAPFSTSWGYGAAVAFTGTKPDNSTVTATFHTPQALEFEHFTFTGFTGLESVSWAQGFNYHQFDNIDVSDTPEPSTWIALASALALLGLWKLRLLKSGTAR